MIEHICGFDRKDVLKSKENKSINIHDHILQTVYK